MRESSLPLLQSTCTAGSSSLATTQHWLQSGPQRSGCQRPAGLRQPGPLPLCVTQPARAVLATRYWQSEWRRRGRRAAADVEPAEQVQLEFASEVQVQVYWQLDPNHVEFQSAVANFEVGVLKSRGFKFKTLPRRSRGTCTGSRRRPHVPVI